MTTSTTDTSVKMVLDRWFASIKSFDTLMSNLSDSRLMNEIAPGKNRGIYLLGHLIAVHDDLIVLLDMGDKLYPELNTPFIKTPDNVNTSMPSVSELRSYWSRQCDVIKQKFEQLNQMDWFEKHTAVSSEDFINEPHRNKLNIVITRTSHLQYHIGQLQLLK